MPTDLARIAVVAEDERYVELDNSWPLLREALVEVGLSPHVVCWTDPGLDWSRYQLVLVCYVWGYVTRREAFLRWAGRASRSTTLVNALPALQWNSDKRYLADLAQRGVPIVPTQWVAPGATWQPPSDDYVVKPSVSSGGIEAARYLDKGSEVAERHVRRLHAAGQVVMIQPYQRRVDVAGETALVFLDGEYSHAICKQGMLEPDAGTVERLWEREVITAASCRSDQLSAAEAAMSVVRDRVGDVAYARVDLVDGNEDDNRGAVGGDREDEGEVRHRAGGPMRDEARGDGDGDGASPLVLEIELIEPALFLATDPPAATRLATCLGRLTDHSASQDRISGAKSRPVDAERDR